MTISLANTKIAASMLPSNALKAQDSKSFNLAFARADTRTHRSNGENETRYPKHGTVRSRLSRFATQPVAGQNKREERKRKKDFTKAVTFTVENDEYTKARTEFLV